jgi:phosphomannomutase
VQDLSTIVKAYDIRGVVPDQLNEDVARAVGAAFAEVVGFPESVVVGYDMRPSSVPLSTAFAEGVTSRGANVVVIGLASTDQLYYASGFLDMPGAMFTASHNPAQYNGIKLCRTGAAPVGQDTGLAQIRELAERLLAGSAVRPARPAGWTVMLPAASSSTATCWPGTPLTCAAWCHSRPSVR